MGSCGLYSGSTHRDAARASTTLPSSSTSGDPEAVLRRRSPRCLIPSSPRLTVVIKAVNLTDGPTARVGVQRDRGGDVRPVRLPHRRYDTASTCSSSTSARGRVTISPAIFCASSASRGQRVPAKVSCDPGRSRWAARWSGGHPPKHFCAHRGRRVRGRDAEVTCARGSRCGAGGGRESAQRHRVFRAAPLHTLRSQGWPETAGGGRFWILASSPRLALSTLKSMNRASSGRRGWRDRASAWAPAGRGGRAAARDGHHVTPRLGQGGRLAAARRGAPRRAVDLGFTNSAHRRAALVFATPSCRPPRAHRRRVGAGVPWWRDRVRVLPAGCVIGVPDHGKPHHDCSLAHLLRASATRCLGVTSASARQRRAHGAAPALGGARASRPVPTRRA